MAHTGPLRGVFPVSVYEKAINMYFSFPFLYHKEMLSFEQNVLKYIQI